MRDLYAHVPKLVQRWQAPQQKALPASEPHRRVKEQKLQRIEQTDARLVALADDLIRGEFTKLRKLHLSLQKALEHIARHFHEPISLRQLAQHAHLSPSHLSHLFKQALGVSFKPFLSLVRIKRAAQLLVEKPYQSITETSLEVGFNDLRHFERAFKRLLDVSPRSYRRNALEQGNLEKPLSWYHEPRGTGTAGSAGDGTASMARTT